MKGEIDALELSKLLSKVEQNDQSAFRRIHDAYFGRVANFLRVKLHGRDDALQAIANDVLFEVWRKPGAFNGQSHFSTFLFGIAKNKLLQHWGRQGNDLSLTDEDDDENFLDSLASDLPPPELHLLEQEKMNVLRDCAEKHLNILQRTVVLERLIFGHKIEEIAQTLGRNTATLRRAFQIGYDKVMACAHIRLNLKLHPGEAR